MIKCEKLSVVLDTFIRVYPQTINIYATIPKRNQLFDDNPIYYRFSFSKEGEVRKEKLYKKEIPNTSVLVEKIKSNFLENKQLISLGYHYLCDNQIYNGIKLVNTLEERLNIYFPLNETSLFNKNRDFFIEKKKVDFISYATKPIEKNVVDFIKIRPRSEHKSNILYTFNNYELSSYKKKKILEYYYSVNDDFNKNDFEIIMKIIYEYINNYLEEHPIYHYNLDRNYQTISLEIKFDSGKKIEIMGNELIDYLEKNCLIDNLYKLQIMKITEMPKILEKKKER